MTMGILLDNDVSKKACTATVQAGFAFVCHSLIYLFAFFLAALAGAVTRRLDFLSLER